MENKYPDMLSRFIIEIFPILSEQQKVKWRMNAGILGIEPYYIRFGIINGVFYYNDEICNILINFCRQQVKENHQKKKKIYI